MARYLLLKQGGLSTADVVDSTGSYGAFVDAKSALAGYKFRVFLSAAASLDDQVASIGQEALCWFMKTPTLPGNPRVCVPWDIGSAPDYPSAASPSAFTLSPVVDGSFKVSRTRIAIVRNNVRVNFDWDPRTNTLWRSGLHHRYREPDLLVVRQLHDRRDAGHGGGGERPELRAAGAGLEPADGQGWRDGELDLTRFFDLRNEPRIVTGFEILLSGLRPESRARRQVRLRLGRAHRLPEGGLRWVVGRQGVPRHDREACQGRRHALLGHGGRGLDAPGDPLPAGPGDLTNGRRTVRRRTGRPPRVSPGRARGHEPPRQARPLCIRPASGRCGDE